MMCSADDCENEAAKGKAGLCWGHAWQRQRGRPLTPIKARAKSPLGRLTEAALTYAEAEDDEAFARARDNLRKAAVACAGAATSELTRAALAALRARGVRLGRPPKAPREEVARLAREAGALQAALRYGVSRRSVFRALAHVRRQPVEGVTNGGL